MDGTRLSAADAAYQAGDWTSAAREYLAASGGSVEGSGYAFHRAGNALMKLKRLDDAAAVYERALSDETYAEAASVACNLGTARAALGQFDQATEAYERALSDASYAGRCRALQGLAGALYETGRIEDAADAYRKAALDETNTDPGKALNNLGLCFMALRRPEDAASAYRAAVDLPGYSGRGRASANLGMAYVALGLHDQAVWAFERAQDEFGYELTGSMRAAYGACERPASTQPGPELVEGWSTGEMVAIPDGFDLSADGDSRFFTMTDADMRAVDREERRRERSEVRSARPAWVTALTRGAVVVVVAGALAAGYLFGLGYPTQRMTVNGLMEAYAAGESVDYYWVAVPSLEVRRAMAGLPPSWTSYEVVDVVRSARTSTANLVVVLEQGGTVTYEISLAREGVGWKVNGVTSSFGSIDGGL